jgi:pimeloyl-ACP methyl ester carboxylesterase
VFYAFALAMAGFAISRPVVETQERFSQREARLAELQEYRSDVVADGKRLETLSYRGKADWPTIVMLHEGLGSVSMWKDFPEQLARTTGCSVTAYSRYGHGKSERLGEKRLVEFMHHEGTVVLPGLLACLEIERPILLGHSDGASICIIYAAAAPASPRGLILEAPHVFVEDLTVKSIAKIRTVYRSTDLPKRLGRYHDHVEEAFWGWNDIWLDPAFRNWNIEQCLDAVACPVLLIQGEDDEYGTMAQVEAIEPRVPNTQSLILRDCGHSPHRDQPRATLETMAQFVRKLV